MELDSHWNLINCNRLAVSWYWWRAAWREWGVRSWKNDYGRGWEIMLGRLEINIAWGYAREGN